MYAVTFLFALALSQAPTNAATSSKRVGVTPVQKVLQLLDTSLVKVKEEKHAEQVEFAKFDEWCESVQAEKTRSIQQATDQIELLTAEITKAESDANVLAEEIQDLEAAVLKNQEEVSSAKALRAKEKKDYDEHHLDLSESVDACERAIQVLKARKQDVPQALLQVESLRRIPLKAKAALESFLQMHSNAPNELGVPEANAYEFQSGGVIAMLEKLASRFKDERLDLEKVEINEKSNHQQLMQQLEDDIKADTASAEAKKEARAGRLEAKASAKAEKEVTEKTKAQDEKTLSDTLSECKEKSEMYEKNQVTRSEEVKAIEKAMEILSGSSVTGNAEKYLPAAALPQVGTVLAQLLSVTNSPQQRAAAYLQERARQLSSRHLTVIAAHVADDPFGKVKKMIKDLIYKLEEQAANELDSHEYCSTELATNKATRENKASEIEELSARSEGLTGEIAQLTAELQELEAAMAKVRDQQAEATKIRQEEKATNMKTIADAKEAQTAVEQAIEVLRSFYAKEKVEASSLLQSRSGRYDPGSYQGLGGESQGIFGMLDVVLSDFARLEADTSADEEESAATFTKFMAASDQDLSVKSAEADHKTDKKQLAQENLQKTDKELATTQEELEAANEYQEELQKTCKDTGLSYEERKVQREQEIQSLKEALAILNQQDLA